MGNEYIDGNMYKTLVLNGYQNLVNDVNRINDLNVFPVPDGDTGTNMKMTLEGGVNAVAGIDEASIGIMAKNMARAMTLSARGNSGVILSQFFKGLSLGLDGKDKVNALGMLEGFEAGVKQAYKVVSKPTEGTILTVMREASEKTREEINNLNCLEDFFECFLKEAHASLERTPELLPVLKEAGVIDSGGAGYNCIIEGMGYALDGNILTNIENFEKKDKNNNQASAFNADSVLEFGYCTEFILQLQNSKVDIANFDVQKEIISFLETIGNSIVAFKDEDIVKVHVHTFTPGKVIDFCQQFGEYITFKMENMSVQHSEIQVAKKEHKKYAVVAVSSGEGISNAFKEMGCDYIVSGGQTMNPSSEDFINAFKMLDAEYIFVFPNNSNIIMAANQAKENYDKAIVKVIPTKSIAACYSALSMLDYSSDNVDEIIDNFNSTISNVTACQVTYSIRDSKIDDLDIKKGDYMAIVDGKIVAANKDKVAIISEMLACVKDLSYKEVATIICGIDVTNQEKEKIKELFSNSYPDIEIGMIDGKQDVYSFIISLE